LQLVTKSDGLKFHDFYNGQRFFVLLSWHIVLLCKGVDNYCTSSCHFEITKPLVIMFYIFFKYFILIQFNSNYFTFFHNILYGSSSRDILKICNISITFDNKTWRIKHWLDFMWLLLMWLHLIIHVKKTSNACSKFKNSNSNVKIKTEGRINIWVIHHLKKLALSNTYTLLRI